jgi:phosphate-selective porin OprO and OprP
MPRPYERRVRRLYERVPRTDVRALIVVAVVMLIVAGSRPGSAQQGNGSPPPPIDDTIEAGEADAVEPARRLVRWNEYEGPFFTIRFGGGFLYEFAGYAQDDNSKAQIDLTSEAKVRDTRVLFKGRLKFKRSVTWSAGFMYDGPTDEWLVRETGVMIEMPEISGHLFVGRSKEGFSLNKIMVGYAGWTQERSMINDATIPILADGVKWLGYAPKIHLLWNVGAYADWLSEGQGFSTYDNQFVGRVAWLPYLSTDGARLLHLGINLRYGHPHEGTLKLRSRPESFPSPYFVDTGDFAAQSTRMTSLEAYSRRGSVLIGSEYFFQKVDAPESGDPLFHGGEVAATWLITGETRTYNTRGGFFNQVSPARPVFQGGPGGWELVGRVSYIDLDSGSLEGGRFWRVTPMVNWYLSDHVRLEMTYGYGTLDRFELRGHTHFFQTRLQLQM